MSYTEIYKFKSNGDAELFGEIKNSWRGVMSIWDILDKRYLPKYYPQFDPTTEIFRSSDVYGNVIKEVWGLGNNETVSRVDRICLKTTFDKFIEMTYNDNEDIRNTVPIIPQSGI